MVDRGARRKGAGQSLKRKARKRVSGGLRVGDIRILILEDEDADAWLMEAELERAAFPFTSRHVATEPSFQRALDEFHPHAILSDYRLPGFTGLDALAHVRSRGLDTAFIIVTGSQTEEVVAECFQHGADDYLLKSSLTRLPGALLNALHRRQAVREREETLARLRERERQLGEAQGLAHLGSWETDHRAGTVTWSDELCRIWGVSPDHAPGTDPLLVHILAEDRDLVRWAVEENAAGRPFELVFRVARPDGQVRTVHGRATVGVDAAGKRLRTLGTVLDITEVRTAHEQVQKSESRFAKLFLRNPAAISLVTGDGRLVDVNEKYAELFGHAREEMVGRTVFELGIWTDPARRAELIGRLQATGTLRNVEAKFSRKNGDSFDALISMEMLDVDDESLLVTMFTDITELRRSQEELRLLARGLQAIREEERTRMAREIHDELGQALTAIKMDLSWVRQRLREDQADLAARCAAGMGLADGTIDTVRRLSAELRPSVLDDLGLSAAVEWIVEDYQRRSGVEATLEMEMDGAGVPRDLATAAFRIVQEALTNVARHSAADHVWVRLTQHDGGLTLEVRDNGRGLPVGATEPKAGLGVLGMRERAAGAGGELTLTGAPGGGAVVRATFPREAPR